MADFGQLRPLAPGFAPPTPLRRMGEAPLDMARGTAAQPDLNRDFGHVNPQHRARHALLLPRYDALPSAIEHAGDSG